MYQFPNEEIMLFYDLQQKQLCLTQVLFVRTLLFLIVLVLFLFVCFSLYHIECSGLNAFILHNVAFFMFTKLLSYISSLFCISTLSIR